MWKKDREGEEGRGGRKDVVKMNKKRLKLNAKRGKQLKLANWRIYANINLKLQFFTNI